MSLGYFSNLADAENYFETERLKTEAWDNLVETSGDLQKTKALIMAYNRLYYDPRWALPTFAEATADQLIILKKANGEMAYYLAEHNEDEDSRKGLQAQGVTEAGIMKEKYEKDWIEKVPIPPFVIGLLSQWAKDKHLVHIVELDRDEELAADINPPED